ncbi:hypothetical protein OG352_05315 [Streptomyces sp. NBC_01485]|uniref:hypothetical protein n=1 Tax=Streptomyces sp. NBC_01485 TaxID=2903884 RepID=UPI002E30AA5E|nr:hypothetical protein [Streptomyces sp. NBC_01485]
MSARNYRDDDFGPTMDDLRQAGIEMRVARLYADLEKSLSATLRGRLALRFARWYARRKR